jgi:hypothetical protein
MVYVGISQWLESGESSGTTGMCTSDHSITHIFLSGCFYLGMAETDGISLDEWLSGIGGITEAGRTKLEKAKVVSVAVVKLLSQEDIDQIRLGIGDRAVFKCGWQKIRSVKTLIPPVVEQALVQPVGDVVGDPVGGERLYSIDDLSKFLGGLGCGTGVASGVQLQQPAANVASPLRIPSPADRELPITVKSLARTSYFQGWHQSTSRKDWPTRCPCRSYN